MKRKVFEIEQNRMMEQNECIPAENEPKLNMTTKRAIKDADRRRHLKCYDSFDALLLPACLSDAQG